MSCNCIIEFNAAAYIRDRLCATVKHCLGIRVSEVKLGHRLIEDLHCDSIDHVEIAMAIEDRFGIAITDDEAARCSTVADYADLIGDKLKAAFPAAGGAQCAAS
ncbi:MAG: acyl carrier protein [Alphaproteobacteria bacterium HGW-Alphaproteobacteria-13]|nr:MAG: acyl carrier protein [Alphaproteobacteria bacterium HGW-Alphaproteobacteria-13]